MASNNTRYWLAVHHTYGISYTTWQKHFNNLSPEKVLNDKVLIQKSGLKPDVKNRLLDPDWEKIDSELSWSLDDNNNIITYFDDNYPNILKEIPFPPLILYAMGNVQLLNNHQIAMVGSRNATPNGLSTAKRFAYTLANAGLTITSGLALGIDTASHEGALTAGGNTIAVLGTGVDVIYPHKNIKLASKIRDNGVIISEFPLGTKPHAKNFPKRNRIISGLSVATLVIEASLRSGSLITAKFALEQNREVLAIPGSIHQPQSRGCHSLLKQGAALVENVEDVLNELQQFTNNGVINSSQCIENKGIYVELENECTNMLQYVGFEVTPIDVIITISKLDFHQVMAQLAQLELCGLIQKVHGGYVKLVRDSL